MNDRLAQLVNAIQNSWSLKSSTKWNADKPAMGQCGVTALVVHDFMGGNIKKTKLPDGWHFYNVIDEERYDLTSSQFEEDIEYMDMSSNREEAYSDTNESQYKFLKQAVLKELKNVNLS